VCQEPLDEVRNDQKFLSVVVTETKPGFTLTTHYPTAVLTVEKPMLSICKESPESQVKHQEHVSDFFSMRSLFIRCLFLQASWLTGIVATSEGASLLKMLEQFTKRTAGTHFFSSTTIFIPYAHHTRMI
jgi:hypothetical protein